MKRLVVAIILFCSCLVAGWAQDRPAYCDDVPQEYAKGVKVAQKKRGKLPKFDTEVATFYKVQVAILRNSDPRDYPFHASLVARFRPCEQVWVIESKKTFDTRKAAEKEKAQLRKLGYSGSYVIPIVGYQ
jgi:hypothetical protein